MRKTRGGGEEVRDEKTDDIWVRKCREREGGGTVSENENVRMK